MLHRVGHRDNFYFCMMVAEMTTLIATPTCYFITPSI